MPNPLRKLNALFLVIFLINFYLFSPKTVISRLRKCKYLPTGCFAVYQQDNFGGNYIRICKNVSNIRIQYNILPHNVRSIQLGPNTHLAIYPDRDYYGQYRILNQDAPTLDCETASIKVNPDASKLPPVRYLPVKPAKKPITRPLPIKINPPARNPTIRPPSIRPVPPARRPNIRPPVRRPNIVPPPYRLVTPARNPTIKPPKLIRVAPARNPTIRPPSFHINPPARNPTIRPPTLIRVAPARNPTIRPPSFHINPPAKNPTIRPPSIKPVAPIHPAAVIPKRIINPYLPTKPVIPKVPTAEVAKLPVKNLTNTAKIFHEETKVAGPPQPAYDDESKRKIGYLVDDHQYEWLAHWTLPKYGDSTIKFYAAGKSDITIGISVALRDTRPNHMYEIVIGHDNNFKSLVRNGEDGKVVCNFPGVVIGNPHTLNRYKVIVRESQKTLTVKSQGKVLFTCHHEDFINNLAYFSFTSGEHEPVYYYNIRAVPNEDEPKPRKDEDSFTPVGFGMFTRWKDDWRLPERGHGSIIFSAKAKHDIVVGISPTKDTHADMYKVIIGGKGNTETWIQRGEFGKPICSNKVGIDDASDLKHYLIIVNKRRDKVAVFQDGTLILECVHSGKAFSTEVLYYSFTSGDDQITYSYIGSVHPQVIPKVAPQVRYTGAGGQYNITVSHNDYSIKNVKTNKGVVRPVLKRTFKSGNRLVTTRSYGYTVSRGHLIKWNPKWVLPEKGKGYVLFAATGMSEIHVILTTTKVNSEPKYDIILGDDDNKRTIIQRNGNTICTMEQPIKNIDKLNTYMIKVNYNIKRFSIYQNNVRLFRCIDPNFIRAIQWFNFSAGDDEVNYFNVRAAAYKDGKLSSYTGTPKPVAAAAKPVAAVAKPLVVSAPIKK